MLSYDEVKLMHEYHYYANTTYHPIMDLITEEQMYNLLNVAKERGILLSTIDPLNIIKVGLEPYDTRIVQSNSIKFDWDNEVFVDPMLKKYTLVNDDGLYCDLCININRALMTKEIPLEYEPLMAYNTNSNFMDIRTVRGKRPYPPRLYDADMLHTEVVRLAIKENRLINKIKKPNRYFKNPKDMEKPLFKSGFKTDYKKYWKDSYVINLANYGYRGVRSRIEQWSWEHHVMLYYKYADSRLLLNNLVLDDDGIYCKIFVPYTLTERYIEDYLFALMDINPINGYISSLAYNGYFNMTEYYKKYIETDTFNQPYWVRGERQEIKQKRKEARRKLFEYYRNMYGKKGEVNNG